MKLQPLNKFRNQYRTYGLYDDYVLPFYWGRGLCAKRIIFHTEKVEEVRLMFIKDRSWRRIHGTTSRR